MANTKDQYLTRIEKNSNKVKKLQRDGWEITGQAHNILFNEFHLRKPNPDYVSPESRAAQKQAQAPRASSSKPKAPRTSTSKAPADVSMRESIWSGRLEALSQGLNRAEQRMRAAQWALENEPKTNSAEKLAQAEKEVAKLRAQIQELEAKIKDSEAARAERRARKGLLPEGE